MSLPAIDLRPPDEDPPKVSKACTKCERERHLRDFPRNRETRDGLSSWCRWCHREATRDSIAYACSPTALRAWLNLS